MFSPVLYRSRTRLDRIYIVGRQYSYRSTCREGSLTKKRAMFKKGCPVNQRSLLSGADRKKLRRGLEKAFGDGLGDEGLDALLPNKLGEVELCKVPAPSRSVLYVHDKCPIVVRRLSIEAYGRRCVICKASVRMRRSCMHTACMQQGSPTSSALYKHVPSYQHVTGWC